MILKAGIVGFGKMGKLHCKGYLAVGVEVVGVYDTGAKDSEIKVFSSVSDLIKQCDVISICSPSSTHKKIAEECIKQGVVVMVEKPLTLNVTDCQILVDLAKQNNVKVSVGHIERFNASFQVLKENIAMVGKISAVEAERTNPSSNRISDADVIADLTVHDLDLIHNICGGDRITDIVVSHVSRPDRGKDIDKIIVLGTLNNIKIGVYTSRISTVAVRKITVKGSKGILKADLLLCQVFFDDKEIPVQSCDQIISQIGSFTNSIINNTVPVVTAIDGLFSVQAGDDIRNSANSTETSI